MVFREIDFVIEKAGLIFTCKITRSRFYGYNLFIIFWSWDIFGRGSNVQESLEFGLFFGAQQSCNQNAGENMLVMFFCFKNCSNCMLYNKTLTLFIIF